AVGEGVMKAMLMRKIRAGSRLLVAGAAIGIGLIAHAAGAQKRTQAAGVPAAQERPARPEQRSKGAGSRKLLQELDWALTGVDTDKGTISALSRWTWNS